MQMAMDQLELLPEVLMFLVSFHPPHLPLFLALLPSSRQHSLSCFPICTQVPEKDPAGKLGTTRRGARTPSLVLASSTVYQAEAWGLASISSWPSIGRKSLGVPRVSLPGSWGPAQCQTQSPGDLATGNEEEKEEEPRKEEGQECYPASPLSWNKQCRVLMTCCSHQNAQVAQSLPQFPLLPTTQAPAHAPFLVLFWPWRAHQEGRCQIMWPGWSQPRSQIHRPCLNRFLSCPRGWARGSEAGGSGPSELRDMKAALSLCQGKQVPRDEATYPKSHTARNGRSY